MFKRTWNIWNGSAGVGRWLRALGVGAALVALPGCMAHARGEVVYDYPVVTVEAAPARIETYPRAYYHGRPAYLVEGRWYYRSGPRWVYFREEPGELRDYRVRHYDSPRYRDAPRGARYSDAIADRRAERYRDERRAEHRRAERRAAERAEQRRVEQRRAEHRRAEIRREEREHREAQRRMEERRAAERRAAEHRAAERRMEERRAEQRRDEKKARVAEKRPRDDRRRPRDRDRDRDRDDRDRRND